MIGPAWHWACTQDLSAPSDEWPSHTDVLSTSAELGERDPPPYHGKRQVRATVT